MCFETGRQPVSEIYVKFCSFIIIILVPKTIKQDRLFQAESANALNLVRCHYLYTAHLTFFLPYKALCSFKPVCLQCWEWHLNGSTVGALFFVPSYPQKFGLNGRSMKLPPNAAYDS